MPLRKEYAYFQGTKYTRWPDSPKREHRVYFWCTTKPKTSLHRAIYAHHYPLPPKHEVHHKDFNPDNNDIGNLQALSKTEHMHLHGINWFKDPEYKANAIKGMHTPEAIAKSTAWKHSEAGKAFFANSDQWRGLQRLGTFTCTWCGKVYEAKIRGTNKYCHPNCAQRAWQFAHKNRNLE